MFKRSRRKITALVMITLFCILAVMLCVIYFTTFREINLENRNMLETYAELYEENGTPEGASRAPSDQDDGADGTPEGDAGSSGTGDTAGPDTAGASRGSGDEIELDDDTEENQENRRYSVSTFYSAAFYTDGSVQITNDSVPELSVDEIEEFASELLDENADYGTKDDVVYLITEAEDFTLVTMMDNTILAESIASLLRYTLLFGAIFLVVAFFLSRILSKWIIRPLESAYEKQGQFISDAGHELKTPIATVSANAELLSREVGDNTWLTNIRYENERMSELVSRLLNLAELERTEPLREEVDLSLLVLEGILPFEGIAYERGIRMEYTIADDVKIRGDSMQLGDLVSVLVDNAVEHTDGGGLIRTKLSVSHSNAVLVIENEGEEIPEEERAHIFERFYRMDEARTGGNSHYGLGLSIAQAVAQAHGGRITVSCQDGFTRFEVTLGM